MILNPFLTRKGRQPLFNLIFFFANLLVTVTQFGVCRTQKERKHLSYTVTQRYEMEVREKAFDF